MNGKLKKHHCWFKLVRDKKIDSNLVASAVDEPGTFRYLLKNHGEWESLFGFLSDMGYLNSEWNGVGLPKDPMYDWLSRISKRNLIQSTTL